MADALKFKSKAGGAAASDEAVEQTYIVDTDVHNFPLMSQVAEYMPKRWRDYLETFGLRTAAGEAGILRARWMGSRADAWSPEGLPPGADPDFMREQLLDPFAVDVAILNNSLGHAGAFVGGGAPLEFTAALMRAGNEWAAAEWMADEPRYANSIILPYEDPKRAVAEIERWADDPRWVQIVVPLRTQRPFGNEKYWDLLECCAHHDLPIAFHPGQGNLGPLTQSGWPSYYYEDHVNFPHSLMSHVASLVCEGAFDRWPNLRIVFQEGGWSWIPTLAWRFDRALRQVPEELPDLQRLPSEYIGDHFWFTTQPWEEAEPDSRIDEAFAAFGRPEKLIFASDYPHWDFDSPSQTMGLIEDEGLRRMIMSENALALYPRLPRPVDGAGS